MARARVRARLRRPGGRGGRGAGPPRAGRSQGQHAEGRSRQGAEGAPPLRGRGPRRIRPSASASSRRRGPARALMSRPSPATAKAGTRCRTRARSSPRCFPGAKPRQQIIDLCAGAGGKTLALAALMENTGQLYAYDADRMRLRPIFERLKRAGVRNVQVLPAGRPRGLGQARRQDGPRADRCALHRVRRLAADGPTPNGGFRPQMLEARLDEQRAVLDEGAGLVKPGGRLAYITCSVLPSENRDQVDAFLARHPEFKLIPWPELWEQALPGTTPVPPRPTARPRRLLMTPLEPRHRRLLRRGAAAGS